MGERRVSQEYEEGGERERVRKRLRERQRGGGGGEGGLARNTRW